MDLVEAFRSQSAACTRHGSPMYGHLLGRLADDLTDGGPSADLLARNLGEVGDLVDAAVALRLMGSVHRLVLERRAGELATYYPSVGGTWEPVGGWRAFHRLLEEQPGDVAEWLDRPPQTNEVGRAAALYGGLLHLDGGLPVRLLEIGASGGLNLRADRFCYVDDAGRRHGDLGSPVVLEHAWTGRSLADRPAPLLVARAGCDVAPLDLAGTEGRLALTAYVWADQRDRLERLRAAFQVATEQPAEVVRRDARSFLDDVELVDGTTTVLWHSVVWQYLGAEERAAVSRRIEQLGMSAGGGRRFAHLRMEPSVRTPDGDYHFPVTLTEWPGGQEQVLGRAAPHGVPTEWG